MKKLILSTIAMVSLAFETNAVTNMCVKTKDGMVFEFDVENVEEVYYKESSESTIDQDVTVSGKDGSHSYVDLGLSVKWATCNVGATKSTEYGDYFAWGETNPKEDYSWDTYKWCTVDSVEWYENLIVYIPFFNKYNPNLNSGIIDYKMVLEVEDDAATANWGSAWRMPTFEEIKELREGCKWVLVDDFNGSGVAGQLGISKTNGNTIFMPAAGSRDDNDVLDFVGSRGFYWSSSLIEDAAHAYDLLFFDDGSNDRGSDRRYIGQSVRAVLK